MHAIEQKFLFIHKHFKTPVHFSYSTEKNHFKCTVILIYNPSYDKLRENLEQKSYR
jgi:hypothetical protein